MLMNRVAKTLLTPLLYKSHVPLNLELALIHLINNLILKNGIMLQEDIVSQHKI